MDYKELLKDQDFSSPQKIADWMHNAKAAIEELLARAEAAESRAGKVDKERDAAIEQLHGYCPACKNYTPNHSEGPCARCKHEYYQYRDADALDNWEWKGQKEE